jgi:hypothetical protein
MMFTSAERRSAAEESRAVLLFDEITGADEGAGDVALFAGAVGCIGVGA